MATGSSEVADSQVAGDAGKRVWKSVYFGLSWVMAGDSIVYFRGI